MFGTTSATTQHQFLPSVSPSHQEQCLPAVRVHPFADSKSVLPLKETLYRSLLNLKGVLTASNLLQIQATCDVARR